MQPGWPWRRRHRSPRVLGLLHFCLPARPSEPWRRRSRATDPSSWRRPRAGPSARPSSASESWLRRQRPRGRERRPPRADVEGPRREERRNAPLAARIGGAPSRCPRPGADHNPARPATCHPEQARQRGHAHGCLAERRGGSLLPVGNPNPQRARPGSRRQAEAPASAPRRRWRRPAGAAREPGAGRRSTAASLRSAPDDRISRGQRVDSRRTGASLPATPPPALPCSARGANRTRSGCTGCRGCWRLRRAAAPTITPSGPSTVRPDGAAPGPSNSGSMFATVRRFASRY